MLRHPILAALAVVSLFSPAAAQAQALPPLKDVAEIREGIIAVGIAYEISRRCDTIDARTILGLAYLNQLRTMASDMGYSSAEIDSYINDRAEKKRLEGIARARLADMGGIPGDAPSHCAVGRAEMAKNSTIGRLLR